MKPINSISVNNLAIGYTVKKNKLVVSNNINFELNRGQLVGLIGANGIGKSTLLKTLTNNLKLLSGDIKINGTPLDELTANQLAKSVSIVLSNHHVQHNLSALEVIALGRQPHTNWVGSLSSNDKAAVEEAIKLVKIDDIVSKKCNELSDGQLQKVMLARALAQDTNIIILDEPTTHLDLYHKVYILKLLQRLSKETHKTILFSSHEINVALKLCDVMIVMEKNQTHFGAPKDLIKQQAFDGLFPKDLLTFNNETGDFEIV